MSDLIEHLTLVGLERSRHLDEACCRLQGLWIVTNRFAQPEGERRVFTTPFIVAQTATDGLCFFPATAREPRAHIAWAGRDVRALIADCEDRYLRIALLDALHGAFADSSWPEPVRLSGSPGTKSEAYSRLVVDAVIAAPRRVRRVALVGVEGGFIREFRARGIEVLAVDLDPGIVGLEVEGVLVEDGAAGYARVADADVALVTGMTLATGTLGALLAACRAGGARSAVFAETGHHFAPEYLRLGADLVFCESFPFFTLPGVSEVRVFRR